MENLYVFAVVPHAGTWIEIRDNETCCRCNSVVPHAGTWIEIFISDGGIRMECGRSPRGNVD